VYHNISFLILSILQNASGRRTMMANKFVPNNIYCGRASPSQKDGFNSSASPADAAVIHIRNLTSQHSAVELGSFARLKFKGTQSSEDPGPSSTQLVNSKTITNTSQIDDCELEDMMRFLSSGTKPSSWGNPNSNGFTVRGLCFHRFKYPFSLVSNRSRGRQLSIMYIEIQQSTQQ